MNGLHSCKPGNEPVVGQVKMFTVEQRTGKSGKAYTKIKSASADMGGQPYAIMSVKPTGHTDSYGNVSFNLDIEPELGGMPTPAPQQRSGGKEGYWERKEAADIAKQPRIERQHAQEMALRYYALDTRPNNPLPPTTDRLREMINWFQRDVGRDPMVQANKTAPEPPEDIGGVGGDPTEYDDGSPDPGSPSEEPF